MIEFDEKQPRFLTIIFFSRGATASLGSFLDTFQKIADAASNTKGKIIFFFSLSWQVFPRPSLGISVNKRTTDLGQLEMIYCFVLSLKEKCQHFSVRYNKSKCLCCHLLLFMFFPNSKRIERLWLRKLCMQIAHHRISASLVISNYVDTVD